jgi:hypothetical protein
VTEPWPKTLDEAVARIVRDLDDGSRDYIKTCDRTEVPSFHFSLGMYIRNTYGLWQGNKELLRSCGDEGMDPDDASMVIMYAVWDELHREQGETT